MYSGRKMPSNPFSSLERQNFPEFSPIFARSNTPASEERNASFRWSIDQLARLKPAEIETDPTTLVKTNGHSPENDEEEQKAIERFFSQRTILPSPWTTSTGSKSNKTVPPKRVTFSPLPPAMAYIRDDSLVESEMRDSGTMDAGTQTVLTFPTSYDLERLLGPAFCYSEEDHRDLSNSSLRRKLFGQPERQDSRSPENEEMQVDINSPHDQLTPPQDACKTPGKSKHFSLRQASLPSLLHSPAIILTRPLAHRGTPLDCEHNPAASSFVLQGTNQGSPEFSPIGNEENLGESQSRNVNGGVFPTANTPCKTVPGCNVPAFPFFSPIRRNNEGAPPTSPMVVGNNRHMSTGKTTSTPNTAVMKRQLAVSPFASPVLKQPCTKRPEEEDSSSESGDSEELAQPLSLADLRTDTYDLTSITTTTCTSYFTQLGLEDGENRQPLHSTATTNIPSVWLPPAHSTMVDSHRFGTNGGRHMVHVPVTRSAQFPSSVCMDSGVAGSVEFNVTSGTNLTNSKCDTNELGITKSSSNPQLSQINRDGGDQAFDLQNAAEPDRRNEEKRSHFLPLGSQQVPHTRKKHPDLPTIHESEQAGLISRNTAPSQADSGLVLGNSPEVNLHIQMPASNRSQYKATATTLYDPTLLTHPPTQAGAQLPVSHAPKISTLLGLHYNTGIIPTHCTSTPLQSTPSRYSSSLAPLGPTFPPHGKFTNKAVFHSSVLPSRLKVYPSPSSLPLPSSATMTHSTPSRYSGFRCSAQTALGAGDLSGLMEEVIRKKENLKSRLQFNSPAKCVSPLTPLSSPTCFSPGAVATHFPSLSQPRLPLSEATLNIPHPRTPSNSSPSPLHIPFTSTVHNPFGGRRLNWKRPRTIL